MSKIINLDKLVEEDKQIKLGGKMWKIPGELPVKFMFKIMEVQETINNGLETEGAQQKMFKLFHEVFIIRHPELTYEQFENMVSFKIIPHLSGAIFGDYDEEEINKAYDKAMNEAEKKTGSKVEVEQGEN